MAVLFDNQKVTHPDAISALERLQKDLRFEKIFKDGNITPKEFEDLQYPNLERKVDKKLLINNAEALGITIKEYVGLLVEANEKQMISGSIGSLMIFLDEATKTYPSDPVPVLKPKPPKDIYAAFKPTPVEPDLSKDSIFRKALEGRNDPSMGVSSRAKWEVHVGTAKLATDLGINLIEFPISFPKMSATLLDDQKGKQSLKLVGEIKIRKELYYPVVLEQNAAGQTVASIPGIKNASELKDIKQNFPTPELLQNLVSSKLTSKFKKVELSNSGFAEDGNFYVSAKFIKGNEKFDNKLFTFQNNQLKEVKFSKVANSTINGLPLEDFKLKNGTFISLEPKEYPKDQPEAERVIRFKNHSSYIR
jgi:predicted nucleic acid-binding protein